MGGYFQKAKIHVPKANINLHAKLQSVQELTLVCKILNVSARTNQCQ